MLLEPDYFEIKAKWFVYDSSIHIETRDEKPELATISLCTDRCRERVQEIYVYYVFILKT